MISASRMSMGTQSRYDRTPAAVLQSPAPITPVKPHTANAGGGTETARMQGILGILPLSLSFSFSLFLFLFLFTSRCFCSCLHYFLLCFQQQMRCHRLQLLPPLSHIRPPQQQHQKRPPPHRRHRGGGVGGPLAAPTRTRTTGYRTIHKTTPFSSSSSSSSPSSSFFFFSLSLSLTSVVMICSHFQRLVFCASIHHKPRIASLIAYPPSIVHFSIASHAHFLFSLLIGTAGPCR
jgi:hypothetical protein